MFQSSPSLGAGSNLILAPSSSSSVAFQSSPSLGAGSNDHTGASGQHHSDVSILSQLRCWEQLVLSLLIRSTDEFQSSTSLGAGSNGMQMYWLPEDLLVSILSSGAGSNHNLFDLPNRYGVSILSAFGAGSNSCKLSWKPDSQRFQSSPSLGAGSNDI